MITKFIKVTSVTYYVLEYNSQSNLNDDITMINGWPYEKVKEDWFRTFPLGTSHATRDSSRIGNTTKIIDIELVDNIGSVVEPSVELSKEEWFKVIKDNNNLEEEIKLMISKNPED